jgi:hypothetical protein
MKKENHKHRYEVMFKDERPTSIIEGSASIRDQVIKRGVIGQIMFHLEP